MRAFYNDNERFVCDWLSNLMDAGLITPGVIDDRDIRDVGSDALRGFDRVHLFAGLGVWDYAAGLAGMPADQGFWSASCPCPPFSAAGKKKACPECNGTSPVPCPRRTGYFICVECEHAWAADERHLWPEVWRLVRDRRPKLLFGEQVASGDGRTWFASVRASLQILGHAAWGVDLCSAGVGSPNIRQRLFFGAERLEHAEGDGRIERRPEPSQRGSSGGRRPHGMGDTLGARLEGHRRHVDDRREPRWERERESRPVASSGAARGLDDSFVLGRGTRRNDHAEHDRHIPNADGEGSARRLADADGGLARQERQQRGREHRLESHHGLAFEDLAAGALHGFWRDADWLFCRDGKWRPVESRTFPLAHGVAARVGKLRAYGNAINAEVAAEFIRSYLDAVAYRGLHRSDADII